TTRPSPDPTVAPTSAPITGAGSIVPFVDPTTAPPDTAGPDPITSVAPSIAPDDTVDEVVLQLLDQYDDQASFVTDLGCTQAVQDRAFYLAGAWDPAFLGSWFDG